MFKLTKLINKSLLIKKQWHKYSVLSTFALNNKHNKEKSQYASNDPIYDLSYEQNLEDNKFMPLDAAFSINHGPEEEIKEMPIIYTPFEKIRPNFQNTNLGLKLINYGINEEELYHIAEKNSSAFRKSELEIQEIENKLKEIIKIENEEMLALVTRNPFIITEDVEIMEKTLNMIENRLQMGKDEMKEIVMKNPNILKNCQMFETRFENAASILFEKMKVTMHDLKTMCLKYPIFLTEMHVTKLDKITEFFMKQLKMSPIEVGEMFKGCPELICRSVEGLEEKLKFFLLYGFLKQSIRNMINRYAKLMNLNLENQIKHVSRYLEVTLDFQRVNVRKLIYPHPYILEFDTEYRIAPIIAILSNLKFDQEEIGLMLIRCPSLMAMKLTIEEIELKILYLRDNLDKKLQDLIIYPNYLVASYENLILPRIEFLKSINQMEYKEWPLMKLFGDRDEEFCMRHAKVPYSEYTDFLNKYHKIEEY